MKLIEKGLLIDMSKREEWFQGKKWGLFSHFLAGPAGNVLDRMMTSEEWNEKVDRFEVGKFAKQASQLHADYVGLTLGQNTGHFCAPNPTYDRYVEIYPSKCSKRDLVAELADELQKYGIDLMVYVPSGAPECDEQAVKKLEWVWGWEKVPGTEEYRKREDRLVDFQLKWQEIIADWSLRWGERVKAWWVDGCYFPDQMYKFDDEPNFKSFAAALRAGNPNAVIAFNKDINSPFCIQSEEDDYTAGEVGHHLPLVANLTPMDMDDSAEHFAEMIKHRQLHVLSYLGKTWGQGNPRMPVELAEGYTKYINSKNGIVTWDIPLEPDGSISSNYFTFLRELDRSVRE